jgi:hypothetical protein
MEQLESMCRRCTMILFQIFLSLQFTTQCNQAHHMKTERRRRETRLSLEVVQTLPISTANPKLKPRAWSGTYWNSRNKKPNPRKAHGGHHMHFISGLFERSPQSFWKSQNPSRSVGASGSGNHKPHITYPTHPLLVTRGTSGGQALQTLTPKLVVGSDQRHKTLATEHKIRRSSRTSPERQ